MVLCTNIGFLHKIDSGVTVLLSQTCGIANALQFSTGQNGQTWFTEWTENKIGRLGANYEQLPFSLSVFTQDLTIKRGHAVDIKANVSAATSGPSQDQSNSTVEMVVSGTFTPRGGLGNSTGTFSRVLPHSGHLYR